MSRLQLAFGALIVVQAAHSIEEYFGHLWESFPPARFLTGLVSSNLERGFVLLNVALLSFGLWCFIWPVRRNWPVAVPLAWSWVVIEVINGIGHPLWSLREGGYTPGLATAPILLVLALYLAYQLRRATREESSAA
ncbi:MAG TPA: HXXEE domain-containing protein [Casimicrobiaceae bacterium]|nr:HXXEE domain-containing protein [Casimicrobiaceae bacterium]